MRVICGLQFQERRGSMDLMLVLNDTINQLAMAESMRWYGHALWRECGHVLSEAVDIEVEGQGEDEKGMDGGSWMRKV